MKLSITLPSIREQACGRTLDNIAATTRGEYEVIVVSPFDPRLDADGSRLPHVIWIREDAPTGGARAQAVARTAATGDLLVAMTDDRLFVPGWDCLLISHFLKRELRQDRTLCMGLRHVRSRLVGTVFGLYYPYFPVIRRAAGIWYDPAFRANFGDCDLGLRVWSAGGACEFGPPVLEVHPDDSIRTLPADYDEEMKRFTLLWSPRFGEGWSVDRLRDFNIDVDPDRFLFASHTIANNWTGFPKLRAVRGGFSLPGFVRRVRRRMLRA